jgi:hypothetical protein
MVVIWSCFDVLIGSNVFIYLNTWSMTCWTFSFPKVVGHYQVVSSWPFLCPSWEARGRYYFSKPYYGSSSWRLFLILVEACLNYEYCHLCLLQREACRYFARYDITKTWPNILIDELSIARKAIVSNVGQKFNIHRTQV